MSNEQQTQQTALRELIINTIWALLLFLIGWLGYSSLKSMNESALAKIDAKADLIAKATSLPERDKVIVTGVVKEKDHAYREVYRLQTADRVFVSQHQEELDLTKYKTVYVQYPLPFEKNPIFDSMRRNLAAICIGAETTVCIEGRTSR